MWHNFAVAVDPPIPPEFHLLPRLRRATDQRCWAVARFQQLAACNGKG
jgi:hypothetical protein